jgi:hypothetical protein
MYWHAKLSVFLYFSRVFAAIDTVPFDDKFDQGLDKLMRLQISTDGFYLLDICYGEE